MTYFNTFNYKAQKKATQLLSYELTVNFKTAFLQRLRQTISKRRDDCSCRLLFALQFDLS